MYYEYIQASLCKLGTYHHYDCTTAVAVCQMSHMIYMPVHERVKNTVHSEHMYYEYMYHRMARSRIWHAPEYSYI